MKAAQTIWYGCLLASVIGLTVARGRATVSTVEAAPDVAPPVPMVEEPRLLNEWARLPLEALDHHAERIVFPSTPRGAPEPVAARAPVEPLEERGDALLFEIDALVGTPFDRAITMPFD